MMFMAIIFLTLICLALGGTTFYYFQGKQFALRDSLQKADAIIVLAGTRGNIKYLQGKVSTAAWLYHQGWAPTIICSGAFSVKINETASPFTLDELQMAVESGRLQEKDIPGALKSWDKGLGAGYMKQLAIDAGVPSDAIILEDTSLHTRENAEHILRLLKQHTMQKIILVTSPFHQRRTFLTFAKIFQSHDIEILNYYAQTEEWHPLTWFFSKEQRKLVRSEQERIVLYRKKGDLL